VVLGTNPGNSGKLSVNHGTLNLCNEIFVGENGKGVLSITNGGVVSTLPVGASIASFASSNGAVTVDGQNQDGTKSQWTVTGAIYLGGTINGAGGTGLLTVTNSATVTATSVHVYTSGTLTGNSSVTTTNGTTVEGTIEPSSGRLAIGGDLTFATSSALMECNVVPTSADNVYVSGGGATLTGKLKVRMTGTFTPGTTYTLLHADNTLNNTQFSTYSITFPPGQGWQPVISYDTNTVKLNLAPITGP
jgi:T5SS/PEP-CTERM-associated repeat protein